MSGLLLNHNFAKSLLAAGSSDADTTMDVTAGDGAKFPATGDFICVLWDAAFASPVSDATREIVKVTSRSTDELTVVRAQEGTAAKAWDSGDHIALVISAGKIDELEDELGYVSTGTNLLQNSSFAIMPAGPTVAPSGWTLTGAGASVAFGNGTYGWRKLTLTAGGGAPATLTQTIPAHLPKISSDYSIGAFAYVSSGGAGTISLDTVSIAVTNTSVALKQASGPVTSWTFTIGIDAGKSIYVEMPTVVLGKRLPYPMFGPHEEVGQLELAMPGVAKSANTLADGASVAFDIDGIAKASTATVLTVRIHWIAATSTAYAGILTGVHYKASGGTYQGPQLFASAPTGPTTTVKNAVTDSAGYVCLYNNSDCITLKNNLGVTIYYTAELIWG